ncbi:hypothetical protein AAFF_G00361130 [Aldrovandia affinis]|uniref:Uncharacterized protein n=1 Tax=Aldrovandia affinis TaxID=143900 RepID=A0AAD7R7E0_9TELE|nr:hypothetical protein AAFF_G00361130 [Aldrovandia affinis]
MLENKEKEKEPGALGLMPDPPPYPDDRNPFRAGQYPSVTMRGKGVAELAGEVQFEPMAGKFKVMVNSEDAPILCEGKKRSKLSSEPVLTAYSPLRDQEREMSSLYPNLERELGLASGGSGSDADQQEYAKAQLRGTGSAADRDEYDKVDQKLRKGAKRDKTPIRSNMPYTSTPGDGLSSSEEDEEAALGTRRRLRFGEVYIGKPQAGKRISLPDMGATLSQTKVSKEGRMGHGSSMGKLEETLARVQDSHARRIREMEERLHHSGSESCELDDLMTLTNGRQGPESAAARKEQAPALAQTDRLTNEHFTRLRNKTNRAIENSFAALYDIARSNAAPGECTTLRNGKQVPKEPAIRRQVMEKNSMPEKKDQYKTMTLRWQMRRVKVRREACGRETCD